MYGPTRYPPPPPPHHKQHETLDLPLANVEASVPDITWHHQLMGPELYMATMTIVK